MSTVKKYDEFIAEGWPTATVYNTPGMGNVTAGADGNLSTGGASGDQDKALRHIDPMNFVDEKDHSWMRPHGNYQNRGWMAPNFSEYMNIKQSNTRFSVGDTVACIDKSKETYGMIGKIVAFEDNTIRWEALSTTTGVGQTAEQHRCHAASLVRVSLAPNGTMM
jgi:hypothetical protein